MSARCYPVLYPWPRRRPVLGLPVAALTIATALAVTVCEAGGAIEMPAQATACFGCHGPQGRSSGAIPGLAGLPEQAFIQRMRAFREGEGEGEGTVMRYVVPAYTDAEVERMAAYFASLEPAP